MADQNSVLTRLPDPEFLTAPVTSSGDNHIVAWSPDGKYLAVGVDVTPYLLLFKREGNTLTQLTDFYLDSIRNPAKNPEIPRRVTGLAWGVDDGINPLDGAPWPQGSHGTFLGVTIASGSSGQYAMAYCYKLISAEDKLRFCNSVGDESILVAANVKGLDFTGGISLIAAATSPSGRIFTRMMPESPGGTSYPLEDLTYPKDQYGNQIKLGSIGSGEDAASIATLPGSNVHDYLISGTNIDPGYDEPGATFYDMAVDPTDDNRFVVGTIDSGSSIKGARYLKGNSTGFVDLVSYIPYFANSPRGYSFSKDGLFISAQQDSTHGLGWVCRSGTSFIEMTPPEYRATAFSTDWAVDQDSGQVYLAASDSSSGKGFVWYGLDLASALAIKLPNGGWHHSTLEKPLRIKTPDGWAVHSAVGAPLKVKQADGSWQTVMKMALVAANLISGIVTMEGVPQVGANVEMYDASFTHFYQTTTDATGHYSLADVPFGTYYFYAANESGIGNYDPDGIIDHEGAETVNFDIIPGTGG